MRRAASRRTIIFSIKDDKNLELVIPSPQSYFSRIYKHAAKSLMTMLQGVLIMEFIDDDKIS
jgi:hypothetical protein